MAKPSSLQWQILSGIYTDSAANVRQSLPVNLQPVPGPSGVSDGYLRPADGLVENGSISASGARGGISWKGTLYRAGGSQLVSVAADGTITSIGNVGGGSTGAPVTFDFSFDHLAIASNGALFLYDGSSVVQVTDVDLGVCVDVVWVDGYFMSTDGEFLVVTDLNNPFSVNPLKYTSPEASPDPVVALLKIRNDVWAFGSETIEVYANVGGSGFPFQRQTGAQVQRGCVGTHACCEFLEDMAAFVGGGRNEAPSVYLASNGNTRKISTTEVDRLIQSLTALQLSEVIVEARNGDGMQLLYVHLPDRTLVFDAAASEAFGQPVWIALTSSLDDFSAYRGRFLVWCYGRWNYADPESDAIGFLSQEVSDHQGEKVRWEFATPMLYSGSRGLLLNDLELVALPGRVAVGAEPTIATSFSLDGMAWSADQTIDAGGVGDRRKRLQWRRQGRLNNFRMQRFQGNSDAFCSFLRLEAAVTPLAW